MVRPSDLLYGLAVLLHQIVIPVCCTCSWDRKDHVDWREQRGRKHQLKQRPSCPPRSRKNLSQSSLISSTNGLPPFLRLPVELRLAIYNIVIADHRFELKHVPKHIVLQQRLEMKVVDVRGGGVMAKQVVKWNRKLYHLSLPLTCRQIYRETIDLIYSSNTFAFDDPHVLVNLVTCCLPPQRLPALRNLEVTWKQPDIYYDPTTDKLYDKIAWEECWTFIRTKLRLSSLKVHLRIAHTSRTQNHPGSNCDWVEPMMSLRNVPNLELVWTAKYLERGGPQVLEEIASDAVGKLEENGNRVTSYIDYRRDAMALLGYA
ncbi:MAG: hypothetical protein Q9221_004246 [Calogaya cf. arnoldii]